MAFELEALVGHLYLAAGKVIKTTPPGALCEVAPRKAARGRETDTFFALVVPSGQNAPVSFYEQMAMMAAERYFSTTGSITSALRDVLNSLNNNLFEHNASGRKPYEASMVCAVLRDRELYLARTGSAAAILRYSGSLHNLPDDPRNDEALFLPPLGVRPIPEVQMKRLTVDVGSRLILCDSAIAEVTEDKLQQALASASIEGVLDDLRLLLTGSAQVMVMEFVPPETPAPMSVVAGESSKAISAEIHAREKAAALPPSSDSPPEGAEAPAPNKMPAPKSRERKPNLLVRAWRSVLGGIVGIVGALFSALGRLLGKLFGRSVNQPRVRYSAAFLTTFVFGLPLLIVGAVVISWATGIGETRFEECVQDALNAAQLARSIDSSNPQSVLQTWEATLLKVNECEELRPNDLTLASLRQEGLDVSDKLNNIQRRQAIPVITLPNAALQTLLIQGLDIYAFDSANAIVYRLQLGQDGTSLSGSAQPIVNMRRGATVSGLVLGNIIGIAWDDQFNSVVALDDAGVLVRCPPRFIMECNAQRLLASEIWGTPAGITIWQGNLYVLDKGASQIWRYQPAGGNYSTAPTEYFTTDVRPNMANAVDFAISTAGNTRGAVYILYQDGIMSRHFGGETQPFSFAGFPEGLELNQATVSAFYLNDSPIDTAFYLTSQAKRTLYETSVAGSFIATYRITQENLFASLTDIVADPAQGILYVASGNTIFAVRKSS
jgi:hypothetical protein